MAARPVASGSSLLFTAGAAGFLLVAPFPHSAGSRVSLLLLAAAALVWDCRRDVRSAGFALVPRAFVVAAAAWCAWCAASLAWSVDSEYTAGEVRREIVYDALAFVVFFAGTRTFAQLHRWAATILAATVLLGLAEWLHLALPSIAWLAKASIGPGPLATQVVLAAPLLLLVLWPAPSGMDRRRALAGAVAVALVLAGLAGESRVLWVALATAAITAFLVCSAHMPRDHPSRAPVRRALVIGIAVLATLMFASAEYKMRYYPKAESTVEVLSYDVRPALWETALRHIEAKPVLGHGYGRDIIAADIRAASQPLGQTLNHAHNVFLDVAVQLGLTGLAAFVALLATLAMAFARLNEREGGLALAVVGLATLAGFLAKNLTDDFFERPHTLVFWAIAGMLLGAGRRLRPADAARSA
jgi:O-antigen ligase